MTTRRRALPAALGLLLAACSHGELFAPALIPAGPFSAAMPRQVTFSAEGDWDPAWLPDGSAFGYSYHVVDRTDRDRCLGFIPAEGGRVTRSICVRGPKETDSLNVVSYHAVSPGGRLAVVAESGDPTLYAPAYRNLYLGGIADTAAPHAVLRFPYLAASGRTHFTSAYLTWADEQTLVYLAANITYWPGAIGLPPDTVTDGIELVRLDVVGDTVGAPRVIAGTLGASSVARGTAPGTVVYTMVGDSVVYQMDLASGQVTPLYDFGPLGIARDAQVAGGRLVAVVGGHVRFLGVDPILRFPVQADSGGWIYAVSLPSGIPRALWNDPNTSYRRVALSPSGGRAVAETFDVIFLPAGCDCPPPMRVRKEADLWLFDVP